MNDFSVTLIRPPYVIPKTSVFGHRGTPSLGLAYLSATLKRNGHSVFCIDSFALSMDNFIEISETELIINGLSNIEIVKRIPETTKVIGISCMFSSEWINTAALVVAIRNSFPFVLIVLGGEHVTAEYGYILEKYREVDVCILGEGEEKLATLVEQYQKFPDGYLNSPGISYYDKKNKVIVSNPANYRIIDIDKIASPNWENLEINEFHARKLGMSMQGMVTMPMILSRGCPYQCTFCSSATMWTTRWISRNIDDIIQEIKHYISRYQINHLDFFDLTAIVNRKWTIEFCNRMIKESLGVSWSLPSGTRSEALTEDVLILLFQSGCNKLTYAPETGSKRMSKLIKKKVNLENMLSSMKIAVDTGIIVKANIIFGFPGEKISDRLLNFLYIFKMARIGVHDVPCFGFTPYPGSELFNTLLASGKIKRDEKYYEFLAELVYTKPFNNKSWNSDIRGNMIPFYSLGGMSFFYICQYLFRPQRAYSLIKNVVKNSPVTMLEIAFSNIYKDFFRGGRKQKDSL